VLATNQRSLAEVFATIELIGRVVGRERQAGKLVKAMRSVLGAPASHRSAGRQRGRRDAGAPRVYFEEWHDPLISGIAWVGELIEAAGGRDVFVELRDRSRAPDRIVQPDDVIARQPDIIIASWCGKKADLDAIRRRPGWKVIPAVRNRQVYEIPSADILQPGPGLLRGFRKLRRLISAAQGNSAAR
jgi:iron complex transport system substrate-binding protein